ncbi:MAG: TIGR02757 family protein, partial [Saprospiraceae bacterium]
MTDARLREELEALVDRYNRPEFIAADPISLPHHYADRRDREIAGFWVAMLAWGNRTTIINKGRELLALMGDSPHDFIVNHRERDRAAFADWKHRTFNYTDTLYFLEVLQRHYRQHDSLETAFVRGMQAGDEDITGALTGFHDYFFSLPDSPDRTRKHVATPVRKSRCKRLCMYLRWMVRRDERGVDFGDWHGISPAQLCLPLDVHVERQARRLGLLTRKQCDWQAVRELTDRMRRLDPADPARYDFALFGLGVLGDGPLDS